MAEKSLKELSQAIRKAEDTITFWKVSGTNTEKSRMEAGFEKKQEQVRKALLKAKGNTLGRLPLIGKLSNMQDKRMNKIHSMQQKLNEGLQNKMYQGLSSIMAKPFELRQRQLLNEWVRRTGNPYPLDVNRKISKDASIVLDTNLAYKMYNRENYKKAYDTYMSKQGNVAPASYGEVLKDAIDKTIVTTQNIQNQKPSKIMTGLQHETMSLDARMKQALELQEPSTVDAELDDKMRDDFVIDDIAI